MAEENQKNDILMQITERYLERFGKTFLGIYYFPPLLENYKYMVFVNSLVITLRRLDLVPEYAWFMDANAGHYLVLWLNGYFRSDLSDITPVVQRLWAIHTNIPLSTVRHIVAASDNKDYIQTWLKQFLYSIGLNHQITGNWHQRTFGCSRSS